MPKTSIALTTAASLASFSLLLGCQSTTNHDRADLTALSQPDQYGQTGGLAAARLADLAGTDALSTSPGSTQPSAPFNWNRGISIAFTWVSDEGTRRGTPKLTCRSSPELSEAIAAASAKLRTQRNVYKVIPLFPPELTIPSPDLQAVRTAAIKAGADLLIVTTGQWSPNYKAEPITQLFSLGLLPTRVETSTCNAEAVLMNPHTGEVYYQWKVDSEADQLCNAWTAKSAAQDALARAQRRMIEGLTDQLTANWTAITGSNQTSPAVSAPAERQSMR